MFLPWYLYHRATPHGSRTPSSPARGSANASADFDAVERQWQSITSAYRAPIESTQNQLEFSGQTNAAKLGHPMLWSENSSSGTRNRLCLDQFLKTQFVVDFDIPKIGAGARVLASYGLETAYDMSDRAIQDVTGFGEALTRNLMDWKRQRREAFRFDRKSGVPVEDLRTLVSKFQRDQSSLFDRLERGAEELRSLVAQADQQIKTLEPEFVLRAAARSQARANLEIF